MCIKIKVSAVCRKSRDLGMTRRIWCADIGKGLVPGVDKSGSAVSALQPRLFHIFSATLPLSGYMRQRYGTGVVFVQNGPLNVLVNWERTIFFHIKALHKIELCSRKAIIEISIFWKYCKCLGTALHGEKDNGLLS